MQLYRAVLGRAFCTTAYIHEGRAKINKFVTDENGTLHESFYNPAQVFNRDLSLLTYLTYMVRMQEAQPLKRNSFNYLDAFSASGLRAIRAKLELPPQLLSDVIACDISPSSIKVLHQNMHLNGLESQKARIDVVLGDCRTKMIERREDGRLQYDMIDLDPFGTSLPYIGAAIAGAKHLGIIGTTFTDLKVIEGPDQHKLFSLYGAKRSINLPNKEDISLRIVLASINKEANKHKKTIRPLISFWRNFYCRVFFQVIDNATAVKENLTLQQELYSCPECGDHFLHGYFNSSLRKHRLRPKDFCPTDVNPDCKRGWEVTGPLWTGPLYDPTFVLDTYHLLQACSESSDQPEDRPFSMTVKNLDLIAPGYKLELSTSKIISGMLWSMLEESKVSGSSYYLPVDPVELCKILGVPNFPRKQMYTALANAGFSFARSYINGDTFVTDAPLGFIYKVVWQLSTQGNPSFQPKTPEGRKFVSMAASCELPVSFAENPLVNETVKRQQPTFIRDAAGQGPLKKTKPGIRPASDHTTPQ